jgi:hypothetical protein
VEVCEQLGTTMLLIGSFGGQRLRVLAPRAPVRSGERVPVRLTPANFHLFDPGSGARLN